MKKLTIKGLGNYLTIMDVENFCRANLELINKKQKGNKPINLDYTDGKKDILREIIDTYFQGVQVIKEENKT